MSFWQSIKRAWHNANYPAIGVHPQDNDTPSARRVNRRPSPFNPSPFNPYHPFNPGAVANNGRAIDRLFEKTNNPHPPHVMDKVSPEQDSMDRELKKLVADEVAIESKGELLSPFDMATRRAKQNSQPAEKNSQLEEGYETFTFTSEEDSQKLFKMLFGDAKAPDPKSDLWRGRVDNMLRIRDALEIEFDPKDIANALTIPEYREELKPFSKESMSLESILGEVFAKVWGVEKVEAIELLLAVLTNDNPEGEEK